METAVIHDQQENNIHLFIAAFTVAATSAYLMWFWVLTRSLSGPRMWPLLGSLPGLISNRARIHDWIASNLRSTGPAATYQTCILPFPFVARKQGFVTVTCNPRNLEHVLRTRFDNYPKGPMWQSAFHDLLGQGIFNSDGETWLLLLRLTFDNICGLTFGKDPETLSPDLPENPFANAFDSATEATLQRFLYPSFLWRLKKALGYGTEKNLKRSLEIVDRYMTETIDARYAKPSDDLISRFMKKKDGNGNAFPASVLQWIALNFVLAGRDTSSVALSWFFWTVIQRPDVENKVVAEIASVLKESRGSDANKWVEDPLGFEELEKLVYLKAALAETLRLYPSVPEDSKYVVADDVLPDGTAVPAGSAITYSIYSVGRMESIWGEDCMEFKPERWLSPQGDRFEPSRDAYRFVAFNAGPRTCLGKDLAYLQMKSIASAILLRHRLELVPGHRVEQKMSLTLFMKNGLRVYVRHRDLEGLGKYCKNADAVDCGLVSTVLATATAA